MVLAAVAALQTVMTAVTLVVVHSSEQPTTITSLIAHQGVRKYGATLTRAYNFVTRAKVKPYLGRRPPLGGGDVWVSTVTAVIPGWGQWNVWLKRG